MESRRAVWHFARCAVSCCWPAVVREAAFLSNSPPGCDAISGVEMPKAQGQQTPLGCRPRSWFGTRPLAPLRPLAAPPGLPAAPPRLPAAPPGLPVAPPGLPAAPPAACRSRSWARHCCCRCARSMRRADRARTRSFAVPSRAPSRCVLRRHTQMHACVSYIQGLRAVLSTPQAVCMPSTEAQQAPRVPLHMPLARPRLARTLTWSDETRRP
jgi:hypothetical protein